MKTLLRLLLLLSNNSSLRSVFMFCLPAAGGQSSPCQASDTNTQAW